ncbi:CLUMA_CG018369, isoform A [Clunio marinus]|uniref:CLUMA_CG018369, isoform A n=1 Tax=Clunio marinus TaxID=568069 RepID=A0A1J1J071_9DIPT|nr:CLUMA_CG018369, isoform A [Clunio marinus]
MSLLGVSEQHLTHIVVSRKIAFEQFEKCIRTCNSALLSFEVGILLNIIKIDCLVINKRNEKAFNFRSHQQNNHLSKFSNKRKLSPYSS